MDGGGGGSDGGRDKAIGSSAGTAERARRTAALDLANALAAAEGEDRIPALDLAAYQMGHLVAQGLDRSIAGSFLSRGAGDCGLFVEIGIDGVQTRIAECLGQGEHAMREEAAAAGPPIIEVCDGDDNEPIAPRQWLLGNSLCRDFVTLLIAPGGTGKTALLIAQMVALASGMPITGEYIFERCRVLILCFEDGLAEIRRRIRACRLHHNLPDLKGWLYFAVLTRAHGKLLMQHAPVAEGEPQQPDLAKAIDDLVTRLGVGVLGLDPLKKAHGADENDNTAMDEVMQVLSDMAIARNIAIAAAHHTSKGAMEAGNPDKARGASALRDAARIVKTVTGMAPEEAQLFGIDERTRRVMLRIDNAKVNLAPPTDTEWLKLVGVSLMNATERYPNGDNVQTVERWEPPDTWAGLHNVLANQILDAIDAGIDGERYSNHASTREPRQAWRVVMGHIDKTEPQARAIVDKWIKNGVLEVRQYDSTQAKGKARGLYLNHTKRPG